VRRPMLTKRVVGLYPPTASAHEALSRPRRFCSARTACRSCAQSSSVAVAVSLDASFPHLSRGAAGREAGLLRRRECNDCPSSWRVCSRTGATLVVASGASKSVRTSRTRCSSAMPSNAPAADRKASTNSPSFIPIALFRFPWLKKSWQRATSQSCWGDLELCVLERYVLGLVNHK
jgi:hypothetical protein